eukprot:gene26557-biopygen16848
MLREAEAEGSDGGWAG